MKTLFEAEEAGNKLLLTYVIDWPRIIEGKVVYNGLTLLDFESGKLGQITEDSVEELKMELVELNLTSELREKLLNKQIWKQVDTTTGQQLLIPPDIQNL